MLLMDTYSYIAGVTPGRKLCMLEDGVPGALVLPRVKTSRL